MERLINRRLAHGDTMTSVVQSTPTPPGPLPAGPAR